MQNTQLIKILRSFSSEETNAFTDFIYSPFFNKSKTVQKLWDVIKKYAPEYDSIELDREKVFALVFQGKEYNYGTMKNLIHSATGLAEKFLEVYFHQQDKFQHDYNTLVYCIVKYYPDMFNKKFAKIMSDFEDTKEGMEFHYLYKYMLMRLGASFAGLESRRDKILFEEGESLIYFSLIHLFQVTHNMEIFKINENYNPEYNLTEEFLKSLDVKGFLDKVKAASPKHFTVVNLYYYMHLVIKEPENNEYFYAFKDMVAESEKFLHEYEFGSLTSCILNILNKRSFSGIKGTLQDAAGFHKFLISAKSKIGETENKISTFYLINIIRIFAMVKDVSLVKQTLENAKDIIIEKDKDIIFNFYSAYLYYAQDKYNNSLEHAARIKPDSDNLKITLKSLQIKCYFEIGEADAFMYALNAYRQLLYRNENLSCSTKEYNKNFLTSINSLFDYKYFKKGDLTDIKFEILKNKMTDKEWILQKTEELE